MVNSDFARKKSDNSALFTHAVQVTTLRDNSNNIVI